MRWIGGFIALIKLTQNNPDQQLIFYCVADCWMSWNAAKRAMNYGYSRVYWYPDGSDGWAGDGHELVEAIPWGVGQPPPR